MPSSNGERRPTPSERLRELARRVAGANAYASARHIYRLARGEELREAAPLKRKLAAWQRGFLVHTAALYDFPRNDPRQYLSDYALVHRCARINPAPEVFNQKLLFRALLQARGIPQPDTVAVLSGGDILLHPLGADSRYLSPADFECWLRDDGGSFISKPQDGRFGQAIFLITVEGGELVQRRGTHRRKYRAAEHGRNNVILVERMVEQGPFWRALCPESTNSIRAVTMWTPGDAEPFLACAVQRIGTASTAPTDNWSGGGICAPVTLESGRLGPGRVNPSRTTLRDSAFSHHPDTGTQIEGAVVPNWSCIRESVLRAAASLPVNRYVGWDVVVDGAGTPLILEGNNNTDLNLLQVHGGLLANPAVRRFYETCGII